MRAVRPDFSVPDDGDNDNDLPGRIERPGVLDVLDEAVSTDFAWHAARQVSIYDLLIELDGRSKQAGR